MTGAANKVSRKENWPNILLAEIERAQGREFKWGTFDCFLFAADVVQAMTGTDFAEVFRGKYKTKTKAYRLLKDHSGGLHEVLDALLGESIPVAFAGRGDVVTVETEEGVAVGICIGSQLAGPRPGVGLTFVPMGHALKAWRV